MVTYELSEGEGPELGGEILAAERGSNMAGPGTQGSFVVRIWLEGESREDPTWRGHIRHVQGEDESYFQNLSC